MTLPLASVILSTTWGVTRYPPLTVLVGDPDQLPSVGAAVHIQLLGSAGLAADAVTGHIGVFAAAGAVMFCQSAD